MNKGQPHILIAAATAVLVASGLFLGGCSAVYYAGMPFVYDHASLNNGYEIRNETYTSAGPDKQALDLFIPDGSGWPMMVFVHGGGWTNGDKDLRVGGKDIYRNIGRYYAARGIAVAVINYRLLPGVHWTTQIRDVATATAFARSESQRLGGEPKRLFVSGHSAGAQLATRIALDPTYLAAVGLDESSICGVVAISGAGYDMLDERTYELGAEFTYLKTRFGAVDGSEDWPANASVLQFITDIAPPFLILYGGKEPASLKRQSQLLAERLHDAGVSVVEIEQSRHSHPRMVLAMSMKGRETSTAIEKFVSTTACDTNNHMPY